MNNYSEIRFITRKLATFPAQCARGIFTRARAPADFFSRARKKDNARAVFSRPAAHENTARVVFPRARAYLREIVSRAPKIIPRKSKIILDKHKKVRIENKRLT